MERFDYLVLGGGSGGVASARRAASHGRRVVLVESGHLGGTCVNVGCVPKKIMWSAAGIAEALEDAAGYGFDVDVRGFDWAGLVRRRDEYVRFLNGVYGRNLEKEGVTVVEGRGRFVDARTIEAGGRMLSAPHVLVATGTTPTVPTFPGAHLGITSDGFFALRELPRSVAIVGAGYVATELGGVLHALGANVTMLMRHELPLRGFDTTLREDLLALLRGTGIKVLVDSEVVRADGAPSAVTLTTAGSAVHGPFDCVIWAIGRTASTKELGLSHVGVGTDPDGHVLVDAFQNTSVPGVYAVGDVTGHLPLTPVAIAAGRMLAERLFGGEPDACLDYDDVPTVVFTHPPVGTVGLSEELARERHGDDVKVYVRRFTSLHHAVTERKQRTTVKLVTVGADERVVGVHVVGLGADELLQGFAVAVKLRARKRDLDRTVAIHPTAAEELVTLR